MKSLTPLRRLAVAAVAMATAGATMAACSSTPEEQSPDEPFVVLYVGGLTGPYQSPVSAQVKGLEVGADYVNENGGIRGRKIVIETLDSQGDPTRAVSLLQEALSSDDPPDFVIPSGISAETLAMLPVLTRNGYPSLSMAASPLANDPEEYPYHFQTASSSTLQVASALPARLRELGAKKLAVLTSQDEYGTGVIRAVESAVDGLDIELETFQFVPTDLDLTPAYTSALAADPDYVYLDTSGDSAVRLLQARVSAGGTDVPTGVGTGMSLTSGGPYNYGSPEANENLEILVFRVERALPESEQSQLFKQFITGMKAKGINTTVSSSALSFDQIRLLAAVMNQEGVLENLPDAFVEAVYNLDVPDGYWLTISEIRYTPNSHTLTPGEGDFIFIPSSKMVDGQYQVED
jgi:ABC-type branched-chain amino acid transport systems, periplasmic component